MKTPDLRILVLHEKHGTAYYDVSTDELLHKTCVKIIKDRAEEGWYGTTEEFESHDIDKEMGLTEEEINKFPLYTKSALQDAREKLKEEAKWEEQALADLQRLSEILAYKFDPTHKPARKLQAYHFLANRSDRGYEYERVDLEYVTKIEE